jgi:hypothetical protein
MTTIIASYNSLSLLASLNWDRLLYGATIAVALTVGSVIGTMFQ